MARKKSKKGKTTAKKIAHKDYSKPVVQKKVDKRDAPYFKELDQMFETMVNQNYHGLSEVLEEKDPIFTSAENLVSFLNGIIDFGVVVETDETPKTDHIHEYLKKKRNFKLASPNALPLQVLKECFGDHAVLLPEVPVEILVPKKEGSMMKEKLHDSHVDEKKAAVEKKVVSGALFLAEFPGKIGKMFTPGTPVSVKLAGEQVKIADVKANGVAYGKYESQDGTLCPLVIKVNPFVKPVMEKIKPQKEKKPLHDGEEEEENFSLFTEKEDAPQKKGKVPKGKAPPQKNPDPKKKY